MKALGKLAPLVIVFAFGCTPQPQALSEADLAAIQTRLDEVARHVSAEDNAAWANDFTPDAIFMIQGSPAVRGRAAIQQWGETNVMVTSLTFSDIEKHGSGDTAWATSNYTLMVAGSPTPEMGKQLVVLQRQADGSWLSAAASVSANAAPAAGAP
jgi:ketosteroid isomerase-like protein